MKPYCSYAMKTNTHHSQFFRVDLFLFLLLFGFSCFAQATTTPVNKISISVSSHAAAQQFYRPLVNKAYNAIGYEVEFLVLPEERSNIMIERGDIDGDVIRTSKILDTSNNLIAVWPLGGAAIYMVCQQDIPCNSEALQDDSRLLGTVAGDAYFQSIIHQTKVVHVKFNRYDQLQNSFEKKRIDYYFAVVNKSLNEGANLKSQNKHKIEDIMGYHVLHKKHSHIIEPLRRAFADLTLNN